MVATRRTPAVAATIATLISCNQVQSWPPPTCSPLLGRPNTFRFERGAIKHYHWASITCFSLQTTSCTIDRSVVRPTRCWLWWPTISSNPLVFFQQTSSPNLSLYLAYPEEIVTKSALGSPISPGLTLNCFIYKLSIIHRISVTIPNEEFTKIKKISTLE